MFIKFIRITLIYNLYKNIIKNFIFFKKFKISEFIFRIILEFKPILTLKNDVLIKQANSLKK